MRIDSLIGPETLPPPRPVDMRLVLAVGAGIYALFVLLGDRLLNDPDTHWHVLVGEKILSGDGFPWVDSYSHTMRGAFWIAKEWLAQVLMAFAFRLAGWTGVTALAAASGALAFMILLHELLRRLDWRPTLILLAVVLLLSVPHVLARPHVLALPVLFLWSAGLLRAAETGRAPCFWLLPAMTLWANLHGSFMFGLALGAPFALEAVLRAPSAARLRVAALWALFGALAVGAACIHPYGIESILAAFRVLGLDEAKAIIIEWRAHDFSRLEPFEAALLVGLALALITGIRVPALRVLLLVGLLHMALANVRHQTLFAVIGVLLLAPSIAARLASRPPPPAARLWPTAAAASSLAVTATLVSGFLGLARPVEVYVPRSALAAARAAALTGPVLNSYGFGGWLMTQGVPTFIDGRAELYGGAFVAHTVHALELKSVDDFVDLLDRYRIGWTLLTPGTPAVGLLDRLPGWRRVHADGIAVVHARR